METIYKRDAIILFLSFPSSKMEFDYNFLDISLNDTFPQDSVFAVRFLSNYHLKILSVFSWTMNPTEASSASTLLQDDSKSGNSGKVNNLISDCILKRKFIYTWVLYPTREKKGVTFVGVSRVIVENRMHWRRIYSKSNMPWIEQRNQFDHSSLSKFVWVM